MKMQDANLAEPPSSDTEIEELSRLLLIISISIQIPCRCPSRSRLSCWLARDAEIKDWTTSLACLPEQDGSVAKVGEFERYVDEISWRRKISNVATEWNKNFFGPRGLHVVPDLPVRTWAKKFQGSRTESQGDSNHE
jgi:hypothetical protein